MNRKSVRFIVKGLVQGVGFRYWVYRQAKTLGITGFVRNRIDGSVEVLVQGSEAEIEEMHCLLRHGPPMAQVSSVDIENDPREICDHSFQIRYD